MTTAKDSGGVTTNSYTSRSELSEQVQAGGYALTYQYDAVSNLDFSQFRFLV
jgi:uncharacterized protein RhaS with RHS repeats